MGGTVYAQGDVGVVGVVGEGRGVVEVLTGVSVGVDFLFSEKPFKEPGPTEFLFPNVIVSSPALRLGGSVRKESLKL